jgi:HD-like signal output (HDOD) protein
LCGLVHDIGTTLLDQSDEFTYYIGHYRDDQAQCDAERAALGFDHTTLGAVAAEMWELPQPISQVLVAHHNIEEALGRPGDVGHMSACLVVAEVLEGLSRNSEQLSDSVLDQVASSAAGQQLGLTIDTLRTLWTENVVGELRKSADMKSAA